MAKYYVQSGDYQLIVQANNAHGAALWAVHRALAQVLSFADERDNASAKDHATGRLGDSVTVHEQGFDRADGQRFETFGLIHQWNQLMKALDRLQDQIESLAGAQDQAE